MGDPSYVDRSLVSTLLEEEGWPNILVPNKGSGPKRALDSGQALFSRGG